MKRIITHYGVDHQRRKFAEENLELQEAIMEYQRVSRNVEGLNDERALLLLTDYRLHLIEELADNFVLLGEFMQYFNISHKEIEDMARFKIKRTHIRMDNNDKPREN